MTTKQDLHMHCSYCDGHNTMEEMLISCMKAGLTSIGFSSHAYTGFPFDMAGMKADRLDSYFEEAKKLREKYNFPVYTGLEYESRTTAGPTGNKDRRCDYAIGSVHFYEFNGHCTFVDAKLDDYLKNLELYGNPRVLMENYYTELVSFAKRSDFDIVGHFDLPTKFEESGYMNFLNEKWYRDLALDACDTICRTGKIFEVNTGAISRGYKHSFYPADFILRRILGNGASVVISSDSHRADTVGGFFEDAEAHLRRLGFKTLAKLTDNGFIEEPL